MWLRTNHRPTVVRECLPSSQAESVISTETAKGASRMASVVSIRESDAKISFSQGNSGLRECIQNSSFQF